MCNKKIDKILAFGVSNRSENQREKNQFNIMIDKRNKLEFHMRGSTNAYKHVNRSLTSLVSREK